MELHGSLATYYRENIVIWEALEARIFMKVTNSSRAPRSLGFVLGIESMFYARWNIETINFRDLQPPDLNIVRKLR